MLGRWNRHIPVRLVPAVLACALLAGATSAASADTSSQLGQANSRLAQLEHRITAGQTTQVELALDPSDAPATHKNKFGERYRDPDKYR